MRETITNNSWNTTEWGLSFLRVSSFPLDSSNVFESQEEFETYLKGEDTDKPYLGQIIAVKEEDSFNVYIVQSYDGEVWSASYLVDMENIQQLIDDLGNSIKGEATDNYDTLEKIQDIIIELRTYLKSTIHNIQQELDNTQEGIGLNGSGSYDPDEQTTFLQNATSVTHALRLLDAAIATIEPDSLYTIKGTVTDTSELFALSEVTRGDVYNVEEEVSIDGVTYPSHTNFVYISETPNEASIESNWDSLGGSADLSLYYTKEEIDDLIESLNKYVLKGARIEDEDNNLTIEDNIVIIPLATETNSGVMSYTDKIFINGIRDGNKDLPTPVITGTWTFYNYSGSEINSSELSPTPSTTSPTIEFGYKASFSGTYMWTHEDDKKDPTQVQSGSSWTDLPESGVSSEIYDSGLLSSTTTIKIGIQAAKTGLMVDGENVTPASGYDTTTASRTVTFSNRIYYGSTSNEDINEDTIKSLTNTLGSKSRTLNSVTATSDEYYIYAYPTSLGTLTSIVQDGATPVLTAFTQSQLTITNNAGVSINLYVYRSNNKGAFTNVSLQFT